ncbi:stage III sporulation protein SpoIIIAB [Phosphitispora fastidiosa]|uniref:stage III sporulation protein SpoIIIAB n=1 Tax=Phosphitispora fastidiosa TaxID=2837202 RepID=UPI001E56F691|nr:stage III sporulation protein SpoIIIAB [Phosphitispora fastidiosa]MBU7007627.1 stage III sporulation protein AB [Phosphitispora fastidiosa]
MIKIIGACVTLGACATMGFTWAGVYEKRPQQLIYLGQGLQLLETEILYGATPLPEAMEQVAANCSPEVSGFFSCTAAELRRMEGLTAGEAWDRAIARYSVKTALAKKDLHILRRFGVSLGASDREDQAKHLKVALSQLKLAAAEAEAAARKNATVYRYLGFLGGLLLVMILY